MDEHTLRRVIREELSKLVITFSFGNNTPLPPPEPTRNLDEPPPTEEPPPPAPEPELPEPPEEEPEPPPPPPPAPAYTPTVPLWERGHYHVPLPFGRAEERAVEWLKQNQHPARWLPDFTHNPLTRTAVHCPAPVDKDPWAPKWTPQGAFALIPGTTKDSALSSVRSNACCFATSCRLSPNPTQFKVMQPCQGLVGDTPPMQLPEWAKKLEWSFIPTSWLPSLRMSVELGLRPLNSMAKPPLPTFFEPVHPYSMCVLSQDAEWMLVVGPRAPAFRRPQFVPPEA